jgi:hypothetical protein
VCRVCNLLCFTSANGFGAILEARSNELSTDIWEEMWPRAYETTNVCIPYLKVHSKNIDEINDYMILLPCLSGLVICENAVGSTLQLSFMNERSWKKNVSSSFRHASKKKRPSRRSPCQPPFPLPLQEEVAGRLTIAGRPYPLFFLKPWRSSLPHHPRFISEINNLTWFDRLAALVVHRDNMCGSWMCTFIRSIDVRLRLVYGFIA